MITTISHRGEFLALIIPHRFREPGVHFFTPDSETQQVAYMRHPAGKEIPPHLHNPVPRQVLFTREVLFIKSGRLRVDFYDDDQNYLESRILEAGDTILLAGGGHGFQALEELEMIEVKQGPYLGERDKVRFAGVEPGRLVLGEPPEDDGAAAGSGGDGGAGQPA